MLREQKSDDLAAIANLNSGVVAADEAGPATGVTHAVRARPSAKKRRGRTSCDDHPCSAPISGEATSPDMLSRPELSPAAPHSDDHLHGEFQSKPVIAGEEAAIRCKPSRHPLPPLAELIATIRETHRQRTDLHRAEKRLTLQIKAICRRFSDGDKDMAGTLYDAMFGEGEHPNAAACLAWCRPLILARDTIEKERKATEKRLAAAAKQLPMYSWIEATRGLSALSFGQIVGECGDLSNYSNPAKIWKRMGLAVINGGRQRRVAGDAALLHGYNAERRSIMYVIGDNLIRAKNPEYRAIYDARREHTAITHPDWTKGHSNNDAKRVMTKRLLKNLWRAWRAATPGATPFPRLPPAEITEAA
jgi:hypothetical protein